MTGYFFACIITSIRHRSYTVKLNEIYIYRTRKTFRKTVVGSHKNILFLHFSITVPLMFIYYSNTRTLQKLF